MKCTDYYYNMLSGDEKRIYYDILSGLSEVKAAFSVEKADERTIGKVFSFVRLDHPEIFYAPRYRYRFYDHADTLEILPEYMFKPSKLKTHIEAVESRGGKLAARLKAGSDTDTAKNIHDFILENVTYDRLKKAYSHEVIGPLTTGVGVCEGIAKTVKYLCDRIGIWCIVALSENNPEKGIKYRHAWNILKIEGKYYHLDATFDNTLSKDGLNRYDYFNIADSDVFRDHESPVYPLPSCTDGKSGYYAMNRLVFTKEENLRKRIRQSAKKGKTFIFQWRGGYVGKKTEQDIYEIIKGEAAEVSRGFHVSLNRGQAVFKVEFSDRYDDEMTAETVNEAEDIQQA